MPREERTLRSISKGNLNRTRDFSPYHPNNYESLAKSCVNINDPNTILARSEEKQ